MSKGLFDPEHIKRVNEMRKTWKFVYPTQESITAFFDAIRKGMEEDEYWINLKKKL